jgi:conjugal transfer/entry exclusion protein
MRKRPLWTGSLAVLVCVALAAPTEAFLGFGDVVFDPSVYSQAVEQVIRLEQQYAQLVQSYQVLRGQYTQLIWNAQHVPVDMSAKYRAIATPWSRVNATNTYGTTDGWVQAVTGGQNVASDYARSVEPLQEYGDGLAAVPADQLTHVKAAYGHVELVDGAERASLETIGRLRANAPTVQTAIQGLEEDSLSAAPEMNTEIAVLNKINAAGLIAIRSSQDTNQLLVALAEQQALQAKRQRDAEARAINQHVRFLSDGKAALSAQAAGASEAMLAWRMP